MSVKIRTVALPAEHGGWGFLLEPLLLGLLLAPSWAGLALAVGVVGLFLMRQPLKIAAADWKRQRRFARTPLAERFLLLYGFMALAGLGLAVRAEGWPVLGPFVYVLPIIAIQLLYDLSNRSRDWLPEILGPVALAPAASSIAIAGGGVLPDALILWAVVCARAVPSVLYVRARLRLEHGRPATFALVAPSLAAHLVALAGGVFLAANDRGIPVLALAGLAILLGRAALGLSRWRVATPARVIGFREMAYGLLFVVLVVIGYRANL